MITNHYLVSLWTFQMRYDGDGMKFPFTRTVNEAIVLSLNGMDQVSKLKTVKSLTERLKEYKGIKNENGSYES